MTPTKNPQITPPFIFQTLPPPGIRTNFAQGDFILFGGINPAGFQPLPPASPDPWTQGNREALTISFSLACLWRGYSDSCRYSP
ncbi:hypothetical protein [uncultured Nostoc sp.]|uniref:hypothetical protein n=1 Tax=uncultured Nostoc sp. TaxID=340711 RepID=UPI0035CBA6C3